MRRGPPSSEPVLVNAPMLVDASAWLAIMNRRDQLHSVARSFLDLCLARRVQLATTNWTAYETLSMLKSRAGWERATDLRTLLTDPQAVDLVRVTEEIEAQALELFFAYRDKTWGVDCASLVVMADLGCRQVFGFDQHFIEAGRQRGFEVVPIGS